MKTKLLRSTLNKHSAELRPRALLAGRQRAGACGYVLKENLTAIRELLGEL
jgi:hypothetical protein